MIRAVIFDLDNTLYDEDSYFLAVFRIFAKRNNMDFSKIKNIFNDRLKLKSKDIFGDVLKKLGIYTKKLQEELFKLYKTIDTRLELYEDAKELISFIKKRGLKLGIITNGVVDAQKNKIKCLGIQNLFDSIIYAREFGKANEKPNTISFRRILNELKIKPQEAIYIGDNPETDIKGTKKTHIKAIWLKREYLKDCNFSESDDVVCSLKDIIEKILVFGKER